MLDEDLSRIYGVETRVFNQAVKRNLARFPESFRFQLTETELSEILKSQNVTSSRHGGRRYHPYAFTEQGVAMLSAVLRSETAIQVSIQIMQAFVEMRRFMVSLEPLRIRLDLLEQRQIGFERLTESKLENVFSAIESKTVNKEQGIFFDGQVFDAYHFINDLVRQAKKSIVLIDNYVDDRTLMQLAKRRQGVKALLLTKSIHKALAQDLAKHNEQYAPITTRAFAESHDRFLILDGDTVYHLGASLKDAGKRWFAFSKMDKSAYALMDRVRMHLESDDESVRPG